jgi:DNA-binding PadR family transcriptional regulator
MSKPPDLVQGTLDLLILKILALAPMHGWAVGQRLRECMLARAIVVNRHRDRA